MDTPTRTGKPSLGPVMLIMPLIACTMMSNAGRALRGPVWPKPLIEA